MKNRNVKFSLPGRSGMLKIAGFVILAGLIGQARIFYLDGKFNFRRDGENESLSSRTVPAAGRQRETEIIYAYITGEVKSPGLYSLSSGSRLAKVIEKAGGLTERADITDINPARIVEDGEKIKIAGKKGFFSRIGVGRSPPVRYIVPPEEKKEIEVIREK